MAITGPVGFLIVRSQLFVEGNAAETAANLVSSEGLARLGIAADLAVVVTQALAALDFMNCAAIPTSTMFTATALDAALSGGVDDAQLLYQLSEAAWRRQPVLRVVADPDGVDDAAIGSHTADAGIGSSSRRGRLPPRDVRHVRAPGRRHPRRAPAPGATVGEALMIGLLLWRDAGDPAPGEVS